MNETLRIGTWNIHHGAPPGQHQPADLGRYRKACERLRDLQLYILGLQEVEKNVRRSKRQDLTLIAANITGMTPKFSRTMWYHGGQVGHALLVKGDIGDTHRVSLRGDRRHPVKIGRRPVIINGNKLHWMFERRNVLVADVTVQGLDLTVAHTHYGGKESVRRRNTAKAVGALASNGGNNPRVFLGDCNTRTGTLLDWGEPAGMELAHREDIKTCGNRHIDHIAVSGLHIVDMWTEELPTSDHRLFVIEAIPDESIYSG